MDLYYNVGGTYCKVNHDTPQNNTMTGALFRHLIAQKNIALTLVYSSFLCTGRGAAVSARVEFANKRETRHALPSICLTYAPSLIIPPDALLDSARLRDEAIACER